MKEYIEREAFIEDIKTEIINLYLDGMKGTPRGYKELYQIIDRINEQTAADVVSRVAFDQVMWERDVAIQQLREDYGVGLGEKKAADVVEVVRCKDCKHKRHLQGATDEKNVCGLGYGLSGLISEEDFCSYGERRDTDEN